MLSYEKIRGIPKKDRVTINGLPIVSYIQILLLHHMDRIDGRGIPQITITIIFIIAYRQY